MFYFVILIQTAINTGVGIGAILLASECLQVLLISASVTLTIGIKTNTNFKGEIQTEFIQA